MSSDWNVISIPEVRWYQENAPQHLTALYCLVYDEKGVPSRIRAYKLDMMLERGFLEAPPGLGAEAAPSVAAPALEPEPPAVPVPEPKGVVSTRLYPRRARKAEEDA